MIGDILKALGQIGDRHFRAVLGWGIGLSVALLAGLTWLVVTGVQMLVGPSLTLPWIGEITWAASAAGWVSLPLMMGLSVVLMIPVASAFTGLFLDRISNAVEAKHYPHMSPAKGASFRTGLADTFSFLGLMLVVNLLALIGYILLAPLAPLIFWSVNGLLLGREYGQMVALRRMSRAQAKQWRSQNRFAIWTMGIAMAVPLTIPVLNLLVPVIGAAAFTHLFHRVGHRRQTG